MKRFCLILLSVLLIFSCIAVNANEPSADAGEQTCETAEVQKNANESENVIRFVLIGGSVIGALLAITLLYRKKDEIRYL